MDNDTWRASIVLLVVALALVLLYIGWRWVREQRKAREAKRRDQVRKTLLALDMSTLDTHQEAQARSMARAAGLDFDDLVDDGFTDSWLRREREREGRMHQEMMEKVRAERARQEALEAEAIRSILEERPEPRPE